MMIIIMLFNLMNHFKVICFFKYMFFFLSLKKNIYINILFLGVFTSSDIKYMKNLLDENSGGNDLEKSKTKGTNQNINNIVVYKLYDIKKFLDNIK